MNIIAMKSNKDTHTSMNQQSLSTFIRSVADLLRGDYKQSEYGRVILLKSEMFHGAMKSRNPMGSPRIDVRGFVDGGEA